MYLDDVIIFSKTFEDHLDHLRQVFDRFRTAHLKLKPEKCHFGQASVKYLGHIVSRDGVSPDPKKLSAVKDFPIPRRTKDVSAFWGLTGNYRKLI